VKQRWSGTRSDGR